MPETILIVDDEAANRELVATILTEAGYRVEQADGVQRPSPWPPQRLRT
jgi:CheY-like chemotaxis protein